LAKSLGRAKAPGLADPRRMAQRAGLRRCPADLANGIKVIFEKLCRTREASFIAAIFEPDS
jgi:hypothetical protein